MKTLIPLAAAAALLGFVMLTGTSLSGHALAAGSRCVVPDVVEEALPAAEHAIHHHGCRVGRINSRYSAITAKGLVLAQTPHPHAARRRGARVNLVVSNGPKPLPAHVLRKIEAISPEGVLGAFGSVWIANHRIKQISRVDPASGKTIATMPAGTGVGWSTPDQDAVWFVGYEDGTVTRVDPNTNKSTIFKSPYPALCGQSAAVPGALWVDACGDTTLLARIDTTTHQVTAQIPAGNGVDSMVADGTTIWAATYNPAQILQIDGTTGTVLKRIPVSGCPQVTPASISGGYLWVGQRDTDDVEPCTGTSSVLRIDTTTGATQAIPVGGPSWVTSGDGLIWAAVKVSGTEEAILRIDPTTLAASTWTTLPMNEQPDGFTYISHQLWLGYFSAYSAWAISTQ
jgi:DNA-binding beta-propeller fold protein YncE